MSESEQPASVPADLYRSAVDEIAHIWRQPVPPPIPSGIEPLDRALDGGFLPESLAVLCAGTGRGKTGLVIQIALGWLACDRSVLFIETEMSKRQILARFLAQRMRRPWREVFTMAPSSADKLARLAQRGMQKLCVVRWQRSQDIGAILDGYPSDPSGPPLVIVDQISDLARALRLSDMRVATAHVSGDLKLYAEKHQTLILAVSQTARTVTAEQGRKRSGRDFEGAAKDAGEVEADAAFLLYLESEPCPRGGFALSQLHVSKSRGGPCNEVIGLRFHAAVGHFEPDPKAELNAEQRRVMDAIEALAGSTNYASVPKLKAALHMGQTALSEILNRLSVTGRIHRDRQGIRIASPNGP